MSSTLWHGRFEGGPLEDPFTEPPSEMWRWSVSPEMAPNEATYIDLTYEKGDIVENRFVGMKSRGAYETPGGTIMLRAHRAIESITLDREVAHLKDSLMPKYAELIYNGFWWSPEREMLQVAIDHSQEYVSGVVRLKLFKGNVDVVGRKSPHSLFDEKIATFEDDGGTYDQADAEGFIKLNALRLRNLARKRAQS